MRSLVSDRTPEDDLNSSVIRSHHLVEFVVVVLVALRVLRVTNDTLEGYPGVVDGFESVPSMHCKCTPLPCWVISTYTERCYLVIVVKWSMLTFAVIVESEETLIDKHHPLNLSLIRSVQEELYTLAKLIDPGTLEERSFTVYTSWDEPASPRILDILVARELGIAVEHGEKQVHEFRLVTFLVQASCGSLLDKPLQLCEISSVWS